MSKAKKEESPSFEDSLKKLESLVEEMEGGELSLDDLIRRYEEGTKLLKSCSKQIEDATQKIERLIIKQEGEEELEAFEQASETSNPP